MSKLKNMTPGEMIKEDFLADYGLTQYALAKALGIPHSRMSNIINGKASISLDTALRLARFYGNSPQFWINMQADYDMRRSDLAKIEREVKPFSKRPSLRLSAVGA